MPTTQVKGAGVDIGGGASAEPGTILPFGNPSTPTGWLRCDGSAVSRTTYADLFTAIGTTWGAGDGSTTFNVPDLRGISCIGKGQGAGLTNRTLAGSGGAQTHTLVTGEMPAHHHSYVAQGISTTSPVIAGQLNTTGTPTFGFASNGGGGAHNNMSPYAVARFIIKT